MSEAKSPAAREIIHASDHLTVVSSESGGDCVFVTFNEMGLNAKGTQFWGAELLERMGISAIGFVSSRPNWYPPADMMPAIDAALLRIRGRRVVTYGFSQGAYGALKYGRLLNADLALAFSPQWSINPDDVGTFDTRFTAFYDPLLTNGERIAADDLAKANMVFVDAGHAGDRESARRIARLGRVTSIPVPFTSHDSVRIVSEARLGRPLIQLCLEGTQTPSRLRALLRQGRSRSSTYTRYKLQKLLDSVSRHRRYYDATVATMPDDAGKTMAMVQLHLALGSVHEAEQAFASIADDHLLALDFASFWQIFRTRGFRFGEARLAPLFRRKYPENVFMRLHGVNSMIACESFGAALQELAELERLSGSSAHKAFFVKFYKQLDRADLAAGFLDTLAIHDDLIRPERVKLGFELVAMFKARGMRTETFRELTALNALCKDDTKFSIRLIDGFVSIGEYGFADRIIQTRLVSEEDKRAGEGYTILFQSKQDPFGAKERLLRLLQWQEGSPEFWLRLSHTAKGVSGLDAAMHACRNALRRPNGRHVEARFRLSSLLFESGDRRQARLELRRCTEQPEIRLYEPQRFIDLSLKLGDPPLAAAFGDHWARTQPDDPAALLACASAHTRIGHLAEAEKAVRSLLGRPGSATPLDIAQFDALLDVAQHLPDDVLRRAGKAAITAFPAESRFRSAIDPDGFLAKFRVPTQTAGRPAEPKSPKWLRHALAMLSGQTS